MLRPMAASCVVCTVVRGARWRMRAAPSLTGSTNLSPGGPAGSTPMSHRRGPRARRARPRPGPQRHGPPSSGADMRQPNCTQSGPSRTGSSRGGWCAEGTPAQTGGRIARRQPSAVDVVDLLAHRLGRPAATAGIDSLLAGMLGRSVRTLPTQRCDMCGFRDASHVHSGSAGPTGSSQIGVGSTGDRS